MKMVTEKRLMKSLSEPSHANKERHFTFSDTTKYRGKCIGAKMIKVVLILLQNDG
jgi:hypothetical protein